MLSMVPTASMPQPTKITALIQLPESSRKSAIGPHTRTVPKTGTSATMNVAVAQIMEPGTPSAVYMVPASRAWTKATVREPLTVARIVSATRANIWLASAVERQETAEGIQYAVAIP